MIDRIWCNIAIDACIAYDIDHFFLAPGSRCTPLTLAVAHHDNARVTQHFDERGLAFAALGYARATGKPGVFICTSGTAVANAYPAVIEAAMTGTPMLLFTADRPPELRGTGANQTIDQQRILGDYAKWFFDMPCPTKEVGLEFVGSQVRQAITKSAAGPVHLNWMFREPFSVEDAPRMAFTRVGESIEKVNSKAEIKINTFGSTLVIAGGCRSDEAKTAVKLAEKLNAPLLTDITSGLRGISPDVASQSRLPAPNTVVHFGGRIVSKAWLKYTATLAKETRFLHLTSCDIRINPNHHIDMERIVGPLGTVYLQVSAHGPTSPTFRNEWEQADRSRREATATVIENCGNNLSEPAIAFHLGKQLQSGHGLFIGNSTPIRDMDWFAHWDQQKDIAVGANRGASGIDGLIATSVGFAKGLGRPTTLLIGDLSALHDLNSLALVSQSNDPITLLIINNHGGAIFDLLPIANQSTFFEQYFATPHNLAFEQAAAMFALNYQTARTSTEFSEAYSAGINSGVSSVIELITNREYNMEVRQLIADEIAK